MPMFFLQFEVQPSRQANYGGAVVNCWIKRDELSDADAVARDMICKAGWKIVNHVESGVMTRENQLPSGMQYFEQAEIDDEVLVFHTYPSEEPGDGG
ncbi:MAG: hypothetical protein R3F13_09795 [Prosthecobacter sp.]